MIQTTSVTDPPGRSLSGVRMLVVGASAGIGRSFVRCAIGLGAEVCASARRGDRLRELCAEAGGGHAVPGDVTVAEDCDRMVGEAVDRLGGLDLVLYCAGSGALAPLMTTEAEVWRATYDVNVVGPTQLCRAALPFLGPDGLFSFMSSESAGVNRWGLGAYSASKAALDAAIRLWRHEHPDRRFQRIVMGATYPTEFGSTFEGPVLDVAFARWAASGVDLSMMDTDDVARELAELMAVMLRHPAIDVHDLRLAPRGQAWEAAPG